MPGERILKDLFPTDRVRLKVDLPLVYPPGLEPKKPHVWPAGTEGRVIHGRAIGHDAGLCEIELPAPVRWWQSPRGFWRMLCDVERLELVE